MLAVAALAFVSGLMVISGRSLNREDAVAERGFRLLDARRRIGRLGEP